MCFGLHSKPGNYSFLPQKNISQKALKFLIKMSIRKTMEILSWDECTQY
jgi:hypothetical protein